MIEDLKKWLLMKRTRDNNYYFGMVLLQLGIVSIVFYLILDAYEPLSFLITFLVSGWGFVLLWKSDNDLRFKMAEDKISSLEEELSNGHTCTCGHFQIPLRYGRRFRKSVKRNI